MMPQLYVHNKTNNNFSLKTLQVQLQHYVKSKNGQIIETSQLHHHLQYTVMAGSNQKLTIHLNIEIKSQWKLCWFISLKSIKKELQTCKIHQTIQHINKSHDFLNFKLCYNDLDKQLMGILILQNDIITNLHFEQFSTFIKKQLQEKQQELIKCFLKLTKTNKQNPKKALKLLRDKINIAKTMIDADIREREKNTLPNFVYYNISAAVPNATLQEVNKRGVQPSISDQFGKIYMKQLKREGDPNDKILDRIQIKSMKIDCSWVMPESNFSLLRKYYVKYLKYASLYEQASSLIDDQSQAVLDENFLIEKRTNNLNKQSAFQSFNTQVALLQYMRNKYEPTIASYLMDKRNDRFFLKFYSKNSGQHHFKEQQWIYFVKKLGRALCFLQENHVVHRDLKPNNIMLNNDRLPKIIDFGSSFLKINCPQSSKITNKLRTTKHYNLTHQMVIFQDMFDRQEFQEHTYFDMYAFGMIVKDLMTSNLPMRVKKDLDWLCQRAIDINPYNRINGKQTVLYCYLLEKEWRVEAKFHN